MRKLVVRASVDPSLRQDFKGRARIMDANSVGHFGDQAAGQRDQIVSTGLSPLPMGTPFMVISHRGISAGVHHKSQPTLH